MGATTVGRTHVTRFFTNLSADAFEVGKLLTMTKSQIKSVADRALSFYNT